MQSYVNDSMFVYVRGEIPLIGMIAELARVKVERSVNQLKGYVMKLVGGGEVSLVERDRQVREIS